MRIGYPCINESIRRETGETANGTFRLASYSEERMRRTVASNLDCLMETLRWNARRGILFFRIGSTLVPFASHPVCRFDWTGHFADRLAEIGAFAKGTGMRVSMHPDQFTLINPKDPKILERSAAELAYHAELLDSMGLGRDAKFQLHVGGLYGDREAALNRFADNFRGLEGAIRRRLVIENDDRLFGAADCLELNRMTGVPVLVDVHHHACNNRGEPLADVMRASARTWRSSDGPPMADYSQPAPGPNMRAHARTLDARGFGRFLDGIAADRLDVMLEIKDKEASALRALAAVRRRGLA